MYITKINLLNSFCVLSHLYIFDCFSLHLVRYSGQKYSDSRCVINSENTAYHGSNYSH